MNNNALTPPKVSVVMSVYNSEKYLSKCIESVLNQTFRDFELIMLDDGSTDSSLQILEKYSTLDSRCKIISRENKGLIASRNELIMNAKAEYIAFMDSDDICLPLRLEKQFDFMEKDTGCVASGSEVLLIDDNDCPMYYSFLSKPHEEIDRLNLSGEGSNICNPSVMIRKWAFLKVGGLRKEFVHAEDIDLYLRVAEMGRVEIIPETLLLYRQHFASIGYAHREAQILSATNAVNDARLRRSLPLLTSTGKVPLNYSSKHAVYLKWAWCSLGAQFYNTAFKYVIKSIISNPFNFQSYKLIACLIREFTKNKLLKS